MAESLGGMPLLSGPPPELEYDARAEMSCRRCDKEFIRIFTPGRRCNHCGYSYCHSCTDYQALMPRHAPGSGYDPLPVCAFCIQYLTITAGGKSYLRSQSLAKLKNYMQAYNLRMGAEVLEKDDVINAIVAARNSNGCLPRINENYYRKYTVPNGQTERPRGLFSNRERTRTAPRQNLDPRAPWTRTDNFARPDLQSGQPRPPQGQRPRQQQSSQTETQNHYAAPPGPPPPYTPYNPSQRTSTPDYSAARTGTDRQRQSERGTDTARETPRSAPRSRTTSTSNLNANADSSARSASSSSNTTRSQPSPPEPSLDELLAMQDTAIAALSVGNLKAVLARNHVPSGHVLEKSELVARVSVLVATERRERARMEAVHEREEWEAQEREWAARERERLVREREREAREREARERGEREHRRRREAYRATVESASESDGDGDDTHEPAPRPESAPEQTHSRHSRPPSSPSPDVYENIPRPTSTSQPDPPIQPRPERSGLCVVCQDEEANMVIIDCGHLALCRACADLIWSSSRECPLCRTRIVTESRLLRVFRT
ncbi:hypothetical protein DFH11DRAFT_1598397 [Phellopilus nigrolimitatus]|nr:hypothetical protein DFH11DRAFT_1598397 [Phellopilus nigrolimitatus]